MSILLTLAEAFRYPAPGRIARLGELIQCLPAGQVQSALQLFLEGICALEPGEWEELYTRTWDLNPVTPPYIGFQIWGEDYRRGVFLARLQTAYREIGLDPNGELPDHLVPVLTYLHSAQPPAPELVDVFPQAVEKMAAVLAKRDPDNPYLPLIQWLATLELTAVS